MFTKLTYVMLIAAILLMLTGVVFECMSLAESGLTSEYEQISALMCQIACIPGCASFIAGILAFDEH